MLKAESIIYFSAYEWHSSRLDLILLFRTEIFNETVKNAFSYLIKEKILRAL
jgi:hypothetical protein